VGFRTPHGGLFLGVYTMIDYDKWLTRLFKVSVVVYVVISLVGCAELDKVVGAGEPEVAAKVDQTIDEVSGVADLWFPGSGVAIAGLLTFGTREYRKRRRAQSALIEINDFKGTPSARSQVRSGEAIDAIREATG
jgi:hypothetical protein